jgi:DnaJ-class molecular chaperone
MTCAVCEGEGTYPVINRHGRTLYYIRCPECEGRGLTDEEAALEARRAYDRARYEAAPKLGQIEGKIAT